MCSKVSRQAVEKVNLSKEVMKVKIILHKDMADVKATI